MGTPATQLASTPKETATGSAATLADWLRARYPAQITGELVIPARSGRYAALPDDLAPQLAKALAGRDISRLYTHQSAAWEAVQAGHHTVVVTPTASGKTLCYNLPVMQTTVEARAAGETVKALYLFPTKALSQDQVAEIVELNQAGGLGIRACQEIKGPEPDLSSLNGQPMGINSAPGNDTAYLCSGRASGYFHRLFPATCKEASKYR